MSDPIVIYRCFIPGRPVPWQRTSGSGKRRYTDPRYKAWCQGAELFMVRACPGRPPGYKQATGLKVIVHMQRPKNRPRWVEKALWDSGACYQTTGKADADNYLKGIGDCLERAGIVHNDVYIVEAYVTKLHHSRSGKPGVDVILHMPSSTARAG
jgi:Holliday junction resolvase RusA-like endonuclease